MQLRSFIHTFTSLTLLLTAPVAWAEADLTNDSTSTEPPETLTESEEAPTQVIQIRAKKQMISPKSATSSSTITREQIAKLPQGQEISLPKLITATTPGVISGPFGQMYFRGNHANILYQLDGVPMPESSSGSFGQAMSPRNLERLEVITGGIPAEYGQRLSAIVNLITKTGPEKPGGEVELNFGSYNSLTPHLIYGGSNDSGSLHYFFSLNYQQTNRGLDTPQPESDSNQKQGGSESVHNFSNGNSEFAKIDWIPDSKNKFSFTALHSQTFYQIPNYPSSFSPNSPLFSPGFQDAFGNTNDDPSLPLYNFLPATTNDTQNERTFYVQAVWKHLFNEKSFLQVAPFYRYSSIQVGNDPVNDLSFKSKYPQLAIASFALNRYTHSLGLRTDYSLRTSDSNRLKTGFQLQTSRAEGTASFQTNLNQTPYTDSAPVLGHSMGAYLQDEYSILKSLVLNAGMRFDATQFSYAGQTSQDSLFQPRIGLSYLLSDETKFHLFYGKLFQPASIESLPIEYDENSGSFRATQGYTIRAEKADFYEFGVNQQFLGNQVATFNVYYRNGIDIIDDHQLLNTSIAQPYNLLKGYAYGAEFGLKGQMNEDWSHFLNYSYGIAKGMERQGGILPGVQTTDDYQFLDHLQVHTANAGISYIKNQVWWNLMGLYGSGLRTGISNSIALPPHLSFDTTLGYQFKNEIPWLPRSKASVDVLNILDNRYPITIANGFNGSHYAAGRMFYLRLAVPI